MEIKNSIQRVELLDIDQLTPLQGELKKLTDENFNKLRQSLIDKGFQFTVHVWQQADVTYIIDGHQRVHVMKQMRKAGWDIPKINCAFVTARTYHEAKELILYSVSQYGKIDKQGFEEFTLNENFDYLKFDLPDFKIDEPKLDDIPIDPNEVEGDTKMSDEVDVDKEFLLIVFDTEEQFNKVNSLIGNTENVGYWLSRHKKNPEFFRNGPNRVLNGGQFLSWLEGDNA